MKKVLFIIPTLTNGGAERVATIITNSLCDTFDVSFFLLEQDEKTSYEINPRIRVASAFENVPKRGNKLSTIFAYFKRFSSQYKLLCKELLNNKPEYVISFLPKADLLAYKAKLQFSFKWITSERNDPTVRSLFERIVLHHIYKKTDSLVCQTNVVAKYYQEYGVRNCEVIPNPLNDGVVLNENVPYSDYAIAVGRFDAQKNYKMLIKAFVDAGKKVQSKTKLIILGDGPLLQECKDMVEQTGVQEQILLLGRKVNVGDFLRKAKFFIMSSNYEGMPNALIEAMNAKLPVICTDFFTGAARELISNENGVLVPVDDKEKMTAAIENMLKKSDAVLKEMGFHSQVKVSCMDSNVVCKKWFDLISNIA